MVDKRRNRKGGSPNHAQNYIKANRNAFGRVTLNQNQVVNIEDEMAALAEAYGFEVEEEVFQHIKERKNDQRKKRKKHHQPMKTGINELDQVSNLESIEVPWKWKSSLKKKVIHDMMNSTFSKMFQLYKCIVPGCNCKSCHEYESLEERDGLKSIVCKGCDHGVLQHEIKHKREEDDINILFLSEKGYVFSYLYECIKLGRISSTCYQRPTWTQNVVQDLMNNLDKMIKKLANNNNNNNNHVLLSSFKEMLSQSKHLMIHLRSHFMNTTTTQGEIIIKTSILFDQLYYQLYYISLQCFGRFNEIIPSPSNYLSNVLIHYMDVDDILNEYMNNEIINNKKNVHPYWKEWRKNIYEWDAFNLEDGLDKKNKCPNELLMIHQIRWMETIYLFYKYNIGMNDELKKEINSFNYQNKEELKMDDIMICYSLLKQWRNNIRDWSCHLYAYATPNDNALNALKEYQPLIEIGSGTGYWNYCLKLKNILMKSYDKHPPKEQFHSYNQQQQQHPTEDQSANEYHGHVPPFHHIDVGGPETLNLTSKEHNLFLCYPPPQDSMARDCLHHFKGQYVIYVGEWNGNTADKRFHYELSKSFTLEKKIDLPNWGNTAYEMTIWKRNEETTTSIIPCVMSTCSNCCQTKKIVRKCRTCKICQYCSEKCYQQHQPIHQIIHALRCIFYMDSETTFSDDRFYKVLHLAQDNDLYLNSSIQDYKTNQSWKDIVSDKSKNDLNKPFRFFQEEEEEEEEKVEE